MFIVILIIVSVLVGGIMMYGAPNINKQQIKTTASPDSGRKDISPVSVEPRLPFSASSASSPNPASSPNAASSPNHESYPNPESYPETVMEPVFDKAEVGRPHYRPKQSKNTYYLEE